MHIVGQLAGCQGLVTHTHTASDVLEQTIKYFQVDYLVQNDFEQFTNQQTDALEMKFLIVAEGKQSAELNYNTP